MAAHVLVLRIDLHLPASQSLKDKRSVVTSMLEGARRRFAVAASETDHHDQRQRAELAFACVAASPGHATEVVDTVERFVWSFPEVEVLETDRDWWEGA
jgi:uncharacterized protein YlxP (DUF503 family)